MQINNLTPCACRWILLSCCLTPPFFQSASAQNVNGETTPQTEIAVKQGFVEGKVFDGGDHEPMIGVTVAIEGTTNAVTTDIDGHLFFTKQALWSHGDVVSRRLPRSLNVPACHCQR